MQDRKKDTDVYNGLLDSEGEEEGGMIWENGILTCILPCKNQIASLCLTQDTACLRLVHGDDPERCYVMIDHFKCSSDNLEVMVGVELDRNHCILLCLLFIFRDPRGF